MRRSFSPSSPAPLRKSASTSALLRSSSSPSLRSSPSSLRNSSSSSSKAFSRSPSSVRGGGGVGGGGAAARGRVFDDDDAGGGGGGLLTNRDGGASTNRSTFSDFSGINNVVVPNLGAERVWQTIGAHEHLLIKIPNRPDANLRVFLFGDRKRQDILLFVGGGPGVPCDYLRDCHGWLWDMSENWLLVFYDPAGSGPAIRIGPPPPGGAGGGSNFYNNNNGNNNGKTGVGGNSNSSNSKAAQSSINSKKAEMELEEQAARIDILAAEIEAIRRTLIGGSKDKTLHILAHDTGVVVALEYCLKMRGAVSSLILVGGAGDMGQVQEEIQLLRERLGEKAAQVMDDCERTGRTSSVEYAEHSSELESNHFCRVPRWPAPLTSSFSSMNRSIFERAWGPSLWSLQGTFSSWNRLSELHAISCPILILCGRHDFFTPKCAEKLLLALPASYTDRVFNKIRTRIKFFEQSAHFPFFEEPALYFAEVQKFMELVGSRGSVAATGAGGGAGAASSSSSNGDSPALVSTIEEEEGFFGKSTAANDFDDVDDDDDAAAAAYFHSRSSLNNNNSRGRRSDIPPLSLTSARDDEEY